MKIGRRQFLSLAGASLAGAAVAAPAVSRVAWGQAAEVTLRLHHFLPPMSNVHQRLLLPWTEKVRDASNGRIRIDLFPSMQLGGTQPQLFDQARDGVVDIIWTVLGSMPGRFPATEVFELPFVVAQRAAANAPAVQEFSETVGADEFKEVQPLCVWAHDHGVIHTNRAIKTMEDLRGLRLRSPSRLAGEALRALGANGIPMPIPQLVESLAQRVLDGCVIPWEVVPAVKVHEMLRFHTAIPGSPTLYTTTFGLAMNKPRYEKMPDDLRAILDQNSGQAIAAMAGEVWDTQAKVVEEMARKRGNTVTTISEEEAVRWRKATEPVIQNWIGQVKARGLNGEKLLETARALIAKYDKA